MKNYTNGQPWVQQYGFNTSQSGDLGAIGNFTSTAPNFPWGLGISMAASMVANGYLYVFGGANSAGASSRVYRAPVNTETNTIGSWVQLSDIPSNLTGYARYGHQAVRIGSKVYLIGGYGSSSGLSNILSATIGNDGSLSNWSEETNSLPTAKYFHSVVVTNNKIYAIGGYTGSYSATATIFVANIDSSTGAIGYWSTHSQSLPNTVTDACISKIGNSVYLIGGKHSGIISGVALKATYSDTDGLLGAWATVSGVTIPCPTYRAASVTVNNCVYYIGGIPNSSDYGSIVKFVYRSVISGENLTSWVTGTDSNTGISSSAYAVSGALLVLVGGYTDYGIYDTKTYCRSFSGGLGDYAAYEGDDVLPEGDINSEESADECVSTAVNGVVVIESYEATDEGVILADPHIYAAVADDCPVDTVESAAYSHISVIVSDYGITDDSFSYAVNGSAISGDIVDDGVLDVSSVDAVNSAVSISCTEITGDEPEIFAAIPNVGSIISSEGIDNSLLTAIASLSPWTVVTSEQTDTVLLSAFQHIYASLTSTETVDTCSLEADVPVIELTTIIAEENVDECASYLVQGSISNIECHEQPDACFANLSRIPYASIISKDPIDYSYLYCIVNNWDILRFERDYAVNGYIDAEIEGHPFAFSRGIVSSGTTPTSSPTPIHFSR